MITIIMIVLCGVLWRLGGWEKAKWSGYRDVLIPLMFGIYTIIKINWIVGLLTLGAFNIIRMGYGAYDPEHDDKPSFLADLTKDRQGSLIRGIVGFLYGIVGLSVVAFYHIGIKADLFYLYPYLACSTAVAYISYLLCKYEAKDYIIEPLIGASVGCLLLII